MTTDPDGVSGVVERVGDSDISKPANEVTTDSEAENPVPAESSSPPSSSSCEPYRETIEQALERGRNAMAIWQDLVTDHGFASSYEAVKRFVRKLRGVRSPVAVGIIQTDPGEEAQVDYGTGPMVRDPKTGKYRRTRLFVMTLGYSRKSVRLLSFKSSSLIWAQLHETAFRRLGGSPRLMILDNLREGVIEPGVLRPHAESAVPGCAGSLRRGGPAMPGARPRPQRESGVRGGTRPEDPTEGTALREPRGGSGVSGPVGRHPHPRHDQAAGGGHVR